MLKENDQNGIRLGLMPPLTGIVSLYGTEIIRAAQIACNEINQNGGVLGKRLELIIEDDGSLPDTAIKAAKKLIEQHQCVSIIGNLLSNSRIAVAYQVAEVYRIPYLNFSFYEGSILSRYFFHFAALPNQQIDYMVPYMMKKFGNKIFFAGNNYEWPRGSIDAAIKIMERNNGKKVGEEYFPIGVKNSEINEMLKRLKESNANIFIPYFAGTDQIQVLNLFSAQKLKEKIAVVMGHFDESMASIMAPEIREGLYSSNTYFMSIETKENLDFLKKLDQLRDVTGIWPNGNGIITNFGESTYACVKAFATAANSCGSINSEKLITALEAIQIKSLQGQIKMDKAIHHAMVNSYLAKCQLDGSFKIIENFGAIQPIIPERYRNLKIRSQTTMEDELRLQSRILDQLIEGVCLVRQTSNDIFYSTTGFERLFKFENQEQIGKSISNLWAPQSGSEKIIDNIINQLYKTGVWRGELECIRKDKSKFWSAITVITFPHAQFGETLLFVITDATERKILQRENEKQNDFLNTVLDALPALVSFVDRELIYRYVNQAYIDWFDIPKGEILGSHISNVIGVAAFDLLRPYLIKTLNGEISKFERSVPYKKVGDRIVEIQYIPAYEMNKVIGLYIVVIDITATVTSKNEIQKKEEEINQLLNAMPALIGHWDSNLINLHGNNAYVEYFGKTPDQVKGKHLKDLLGEELYKKNLPYVQKVLQGEEQIFEREIPLPKGGSKQTLAHYIPEIKNNQVIGFYVIVSDVTLLKQSEERFKSLLESIPDPIIIFNHEGKIVLINFATEKLFGFSKSEIASYSIKNILPQRYHHVYKKNLQDYLTNPQIRFIGDEANLYAITKGNREFPIEASFAPLRTQEGMLISCVIRDITERKKIEFERLELLKKEHQARKVAEDSIRMREEILAMISHDLKNPLSVVMGCTELILKKMLPLDPKLEQLLNRIKKSAQNMLIMIRDLVDIHKIEQGHFTITEGLIEHDIKEMLEEIVDIETTLAQEKNIHIKLIIKGDLPHIPINLEQLQRVFQNLIGNSIKFTQPGGNITVKASSIDSAILFSIEDNGPGIEKELLPSLFNRFAQSKRTAELGSGLGLAIAKGIVEAHGGKIWVKSEISHGSKFYFTLPNLPQSIHLH
ncbi:MAG: ABC transporter substrate-binding protein [Bacteriovoracaceae bacterium]